MKAPSRNTTTQSSFFVPDARGHDVPSSAHRPIARNADPVTSHQSAATHARTGKLSADCDRVLVALVQATRTPQGAAGVTAHELARTSGIAHPIVHKRLPDLRERGWAFNPCIGAPPGERYRTRACTVTGRKAILWLPTTLPAGGLGDR